MCKENSSWIHPLADLGFTVRLIEQTMSIKASDRPVRPDLVVGSNRHLHAIVFDCKGGRNIDAEQAERYRKLSPADILNWINVWRPERLTHDVCYISMESGHIDRTDKFDDFPQLMLSDKMVRKTGTFSQEVVDREFADPIPIKDGMVLPTLYYPFSDTDDQAVILPFVLRAIVAWLMDKKRGGNIVIDESTLSTEEIMKRIQPLWELISIDQQGVIREKVRDITRLIMKDYPDFAAKLEGSEPSPNMPLVLSNLIELCEKMLSDEEKKTRITDFPT